MCGIAGWARAGGALADPRVLARMGAALAHRGPDGHGVYVDGPCGLAHQRLAIVDVAGGAQPMVALGPAGALALVCNGEIYNHAALRQELAPRGHAFASASDCEVILHGYAAHGDDVCARLSGMFAFAIWDGRRGRLLLARDRMGQKPLYYAHLTDGSIAFASELGALLEHPDIAPRVDPVALALYLTYEYVPEPRAAIAGVRKLAPGERLVWADGEVTRSSYAPDPFATDAPARAGARDVNWVEGLRARFVRAVGRRLMSDADVGVGVFLSGGLDSAAIVAAMAEHAPAAGIETFTLGFRERSFDESAPAAAVARRFGTRHRVRLMSEADLLALLPDVRGWLGEPLADPSLLPTHMLSRFARERVKVALGGDGGDELLLGYDTFPADAASGLYRRLPAWLRGQIRRIAEGLAVRDGNFSLDFIARRFVRGADEPDAPTRHLRWLSAALPGSADDPLLPELRAAVTRARVREVMAAPYERCASADHRQRLSAMYVGSYLCGDILTKVDRASMAVGLEVRAPFLDRELVEYIAAMPPTLKLRAGVITKYALKRMLRGRLPAALRYRRKHGFGMPVARWLRTALAPELRRALAPARVAAGGLFDPEVVARLVGEHLEGRRDHRKILWALLVYEWWRERHGVTR